MKMLAKNISLFQLARLLVGAGVIGGCAWMLLLGFVCYKAFFFPSYNEFKPLEASLLNKKRANEPLTMNVFFLQKEAVTFPLPHLDREVIYLGKNTRPDAVAPIHLLVGIKHSEQKKEVACGEKVFLNYDEKNGGLHFSDAETPFWMVPHFMEGKWMFRYGIHLLSEDKHTLFEKEEDFFLDDKASSGEVNAGHPEFLHAIAAFKEAKWWGKDELLIAYGGEQYADLKTRERLEVSDSLLYVREGDRLIWDHDKWCLGDEKKGTGAYPLVMIGSISAQKMEVSIWDQSGMERLNFFHGSQKTNPLNVKLEEAFAKLRMHSLKHISCRLGKKTAVLKQGDWVLHTHTGWKVLKSPRDLDQYLEYHIKGELFIFDAIEKREGKTLLVGTLFDEMRTQSKNISLPLTQRTSSRQKNKPVPTH